MARAMTWPFGSRPRRSPDATPALDPAARTETEVHRSPGLKEALRHLPETTPAIADLGAACSANVEFFSRFRCRLYIADLIRDLNSALGAETPGVDPESMIAACLPQTGRPFDLVLAWDVFNYVDPDQARNLASRLARLCRPGARLYAIVGGADTAPRSFRSYAIVDHESLRYCMTTEEARTGRGYTPAGFERVLEGFQVEHSFVLTDGMREHVAVRRGDLD